MHTAIGVVDSVEEAMGEAEKWVDDFQRTVKESTDSAIRSARSLRENSTSQFRSIQDFVPHALTQYKSYENAFFSKVIDYMEFSYTPAPPLRTIFPMASDVALDLLAKMFIYDPRQRITIQQALEHRYFSSSPSPTEPGKFRFQLPKEMHSNQRPPSKTNPQIARLYCHLLVK